MSYQKVTLGQLRKGQQIALTLSFSKRLIPAERPQDIESHTLVTSVTKDGRWAIVKFTGGQYRGNLSEKVLVKT